MDEVIVQVIEFAEMAEIGTGGTSLVSQFREEVLAAKMEAQGAKIIPWSGKPVPAREGETLPRPEEPRLAAIDELVIVIGDDQLEALAAAFLMNPARRGMTFEAYLAVRGFARDASD